MQMQDPSPDASSALIPRGPIKIVRQEWTVWLPGALLSFFLASIFKSGWKNGLLPNLSYPYSYEGDFLFHSWLAQRATEGWIFENDRSGYPFGSSLYDFPNADSGSLLVQKLLGMLFGSYYSSLNLYFLLGFSVTFAVTYCVVRAMGLQKPHALATATLYTFLPFHFLRLGHIFYTWYFVAPIYFFIGYSLAFGVAPPGSPATNVWKRVAVFAGLMFLASFGVYYDAFGLIIIGSSFLFSRIHFGDYRKLGNALFFMAAIVIGAVANTGPTLAYKYIMGPNREAAERTPAESEIYGLKLIQLLYPRPNHRVRALKNLSEKYRATMPLVNENESASLGIIGSAGLFLLAWVLFKALAGGFIERPHSYLALCTLILFGFGTIGGLGDIFANAVSPLLRAWNRVSVFIAFPAIAFVFFIVQGWIFKAFVTRRASIASWSSAALIMAAGLFDQTTSACLTCSQDTRARFEMDRDFVGNIESILPKDSAVYQMPYMSFPESPPVALLTSYDLVSGYIHSTSLRWSFAGMKGREGDLFYRSLSEEPLSKQVEIVRKLGFRGIYVDRRGYPDNGAEVVKSLSELLGAGPRVVRSDGKIVFFQVQPADGINLAGLTGRQIMRSAGYEAVGPSHGVHAIFSRGIDFSEARLPGFVANVVGLSAQETWGRWSDARLNPTIRIDFKTALPKKFTMVLKAQPFVPNVDQDIVLKIGSHERTFKLLPGVNELPLSFDLGGESVSSIEFRPHDAKSPAELGINGDMRKLGLGFLQLRFVE